MREQLYSKILGEGPPLIILHGFLGMSDNWKTLGKRYAEAGFQVHLIDQRNHGRSFWSDAFSYAIMTDDLLAYADHHQLRRAVILGHSMGGKTAMTFACAFPHRVERLLVADIGTKAYAPHHQYILDALSRLNLADIDSRQAADRELMKSLSDWGIRQFLLKSLYWTEKGRLGFRFNLQVLKESMEAIGAPLPDSARYEGPVCFIRGGASNYILDEDLKGIHRHFPNACLKTIEEAGHWLHAEQPDTYFQLSLDFMKS
jgi:pimeloyl-ACP methyl ester carboxylesterase